MSRIVFAPDTNFFLTHPDFASFFASARSAVHLDILWPVLCELDNQRRKRNGHRLEERERGRKAYDAMRLVRHLQEHPSEDLELEISAPEGIEPSLQIDAQIVAHVVRLATQQHPDDTIEFITSDEGLPTLWFIEEKKRRGLNNVNVKTVEQVQKQIAAYGRPGGRIEQVGIGPRPSRIAGQYGIDLFLECTLLDMRGRRASIGVYVNQGKEPCASQIIEVGTAMYRTPRITFFLPYGRLGVTPKRYGMQHVKIVIVLWDLTERKPLVRNDEYSIDLALGGHYLTNTHNRAIDPK